MTKVPLFMARNRNAIWQHLLANWQKRETSCAAQKQKKNICKHVNVYYSRVYCNIYIYIYKYISYILSIFQNAQCEETRSRKTSKSKQTNIYFTFFHFYIHVLLSSINKHILVYVILYYVSYFYIMY